MLTETLLTIFSNYIPNKIITVEPRQAPWITKPIKNFIRKMIRAYKSFDRRGRSIDKQEAINDMMSQGSILIDDAKYLYFKNIGGKLSKPETGIKTYWSLINSLLNEA